MKAVLVVLWAGAMVGCGDDGGSRAPSADAAVAIDAGADAGEADAQVDAGTGARAVSMLAGTDFELPDDDLAPLDGIVGDADVVGIGESVHTTGGEVRMRARLIRYLVEVLGFRAIA